MADEWKMATLGTIITKDGYGLVDGPFGSNLPASSYTTEGVPVIRGSNLSLGITRFLSNEFVFVSPQNAERLERSICRPNDIIFTKKGTLGQTGFIPNDSPYDRYLLSSNQMKLTVDRQSADPLFVYYYVSSPISVEKIRQDSEATGVPKTNVTYLRDFPIYLPPLKHQQAIACILGALDDKIELNRRMNQALEEMARVIFKSWFVNFDPVRARATGKKLSVLSPDVAKLFPSSFEDSEFGEIPKGWKIKALGEVCEFAYGKALKADTRKIGDVPVMGSNGQVGTHDEALVKGPGIIVGRKGNPGIITWVNEDFFPIDTTFYVISSKTEIPLTYLATAIENLNLASLGADSAVPGLNRNIAYMSKLIIPAGDLLEKYNTIALLIRNRQQSLESANSTLAAIRDALLPKLISGELRVPDAEKIIQRVNLNDSV